jgi:hypothetical protein
MHRANNASQIKCAIPRLTSGAVAAGSEAVGDACAEVAEEEEEEVEAAVGGAARSRNRPNPFLICGCGTVDSAFTIGSAP